MAAWQNRPEILPGGAGERTVAQEIADADRMIAELERKQEEYRGRNDIKNIKDDLALESLITRWKKDKAALEAKYNTATATVIAADRQLLDQIKAEFAKANRTSPAALAENRTPGEILSAEEVTGARTYLEKLQYALSKADSAGSAKSKTEQTSGLLARAGRELAKEPVSRKEYAALLPILNSARSDLEALGQEEVNKALPTKLDLTKDAKPAGKPTEAVNALKSEAERLQAHVKELIKQAEETAEGLESQDEKDKSAKIRTAIRKLEAYKTFDTAMAKESLEGIIASVNAARQELEAVGISSLNANIKKGDFVLKAPAATPGAKPETKEKVPDTKNRRIVNVNTSLNVRDGASNIVGTLSPGAEVWLDTTSPHLTTQYFNGIPKLKNVPFSMIAGIPKRGFTPNPAYKAPAHPGDTVQLFVANSYIADKPEGLKPAAKAAVATGGGESGPTTLDSAAEAAKKLAEQRKERQRIKLEAAREKNLAESIEGSSANVLLGKNKNKPNVYYVAEAKGDGIVGVSAYEFEAGKDTVPTPKPLDGSKGEHLSAIESVQTAANTTSEAATENIWGEAADTVGKRITVIVKDHQGKSIKLSYFKGNDKRVTGMELSDVAGTDVAKFPVLRKNVEKERAQLVKDNYGTAGAVYLGNEKDAGATETSYHHVLYDNGGTPTLKRIDFSNKNGDDPLVESPADQTEIDLDDLKQALKSIGKKVKKESDGSYTFTLPTVADATKSMKVTTSKPDGDNNVSIAKMEDAAAAAPVAPPANPREAIRKAIDAVQAETGVHMLAVSKKGDGSVSIAYQKGSDYYKIDINKDGKWADYSPDINSGLKLEKGAEDFNAGVNAPSEAYELLNPELRMLQKEIVRKLTPPPIEIAYENSSKGFNVAFKYKTAEHAVYCDGKKFRELDSDTGAFDKTAQDILGALKRL